MPWMVADLGNSRVKWGRVAGRAVESITLSMDPASWAAAWEDWGLSGKETAWSIASVNPPLADRFGRFLAERGASSITWHRSAADVRLRHELEQPSKTGADRALAVVGALARKGGRGPGLIVSCGTALTVERVGADGIWQGGAIAPGLGPMARALHLMTAQLPEVVPHEAPEPFGRSTVPAIEAGVFWAVVGAIRELITRQAVGLGPSPWLIWTGGDAPTFSRWVEWPGAEVVANLVLEGLVFQGIDVIVPPTPIPNALPQEAYDPTRPPTLAESPSFPRPACECRPQRSASSGYQPASPESGRGSVQDGIPTQGVGTSEAVEEADRGGS